LDAPTSTEEGTGFVGRNGLRTSVAYAPPAAPKATVCGAKLIALNGEVQRLLVTVLFLGGIMAKYWSDLVRGHVRDYSV